MSPRTARLLAALATLLAFAACEDDATAPPPPPAGLVQDFSLTDANPNSLSHDQPVSPRQQVGKISAWYFGHAL